MGRPSRRPVSNLTTSRQTNVTTPMSSSNDRRRTTLTVLAAIALAAYATTSLVQAADKKPKYTISEIMKGLPSTLLSPMASTR